MKVASRVLSIEAYFFAKKLAEIKELKTKGKPIINLGIGSPDLEPHQKVRQALQVATEKKGSYQYQSYRGIDDLRIAIAKWYQKIYKVKLDEKHEVLPLMGSKEGINYISLAYLEAGDKVLVPNPGYPAYAAAARIAGAKAVYYDLKADKNWYPDFEQLEQLVDEDCKMIWVNYPNMPTTQAASMDVFEQLLNFAKKHQLLLCNDNPYSLISSSSPKSLLSLPNAKDVAVELNSLSKSHNMAGARLGMLVGRQTIISDIFKVYSNFSSGMFLPIQKAAIEALELDASWYKMLNKFYMERRQLAQAILADLGCQYNPRGAGLFVWGKIPSAFSDCHELSDQLLYKANVFVTPGSIFGSNGSQYIRISLCASLEELTEAKQRIKQHLNLPLVR
ncbi:pyridoxal phosphate-dependent aminotransferase [Aureispira anguillae]|uniref:Aminotransferase n=1 Tax=Aureispira anguillae TaxID=2864201 RepID=A0A915VKE5_9BACT|nr:aminotransferase class I/II-fold pyridoxal phosphate-dependent enzyme [Aureispira anguillae]BDS09666.1 aminotransferase class I/II-fold pyridoxal phosphate-dependent enzyme [Aureispira anguillae]